ncbi:hypothetical protein [Andreprevotia chitinilytica]|uniref:hypothetical protein n=1 Tax=Andreprevotia chitinilytica TaxID=396808 RepID=UPI001B80045F
MKALPLILALSSLASQAETINLGAMLKESVKKALQKNPDASETAAAGSTSTTLTPGTYDATTQEFERSLTIRPDGKFDLEIMQKGKAGNLRSGTGSGQLVFNNGQWRYADGACKMTVTATPPALQVHVESCAGSIGDVPVDGRYLLQDKKTTSTQTAAPAPSAPKNKQLATQLNCQKLDFSDKGIASLLGKATKLPQSEIWEHDVVVPGGYTFGDIPIQSVNLSEADGGFLAVFVDGDAAAVKSAIKHTRLKGDSTLVALQKVGDANSYAFAGKRPGQLYVFCRGKSAQYGYD